MKGIHAYSSRSPESWLACITSLRPPDNRRSTAAATAACRTARTTRGYACCEPATDLLPMQEPTRMAHHISHRPSIESAAWMGQGCQLDIDGSGKAIAEVCSCWCYSSLRPATSPQPTNASAWHLAWPATQIQSRRELCLLCSIFSPTSEYKVLLIHVFCIHKVRQSIVRRARGLISMHASMPLFVCCLKATLSSDPS